MKKPDLRLIISFLSLAFPSSGMPSVQIETVNPPTPIIYKSIDGKTDKSELYDLFKALDSKKMSNRNDDELRKLAKAFLSYKMENFQDAIKSSNETGLTNIDDLKYFIIADSSRIVSQIPTMAFESGTIENYLKKSINYYKLIITDFKSSPVFNLSKTNLAKSRILLAQNYYWKKDYEGTIRQSKVVLLNHEGEISRDDSAKVYFQLAESYYFTKQYGDALKAYSRVKDYPYQQPKVDERIGELKLMLGSRKSCLPEDKSEDKSAQSQAFSSPEAPEERDQESKIFENLKASFSKGTHTVTFGLFSRLVNSFPGSAYLTESREVIIKSTRAIIDSAKLRIPWGFHYKTAVLDKDTAALIKTFDLETRITISSSFYRNEFLEDVRPILESILRDYPLSDFCPKAYLILARIERVYGDTKKSLALLDKLYRSYSSSELSTLPLFKTGLIYFGEKDYKNALKYFTKFLGESGEDKKAQSYFWLAQTYDKMNNKDMAEQLFSRLKRERPLSFYSVIENPYSHLLKVSSEDQVSASILNCFSTDLLSVSSDIHFKRALDFMSIGLLEYGSSELKLVKSGNNFQVDLYLSWLLSQGGFNRDAMAIAGKVATNKPNMVDKKLLEIFFPKNFITALYDQSQIYGVDHLLLLSLIKQESAFDENAISKSGAQGLMQLMPPTFDEISSRLLISMPQSRKYMADPAVNIPLATFYFYELLKNLKGNSIQALASYNAGPARVREWLNQYPGMSDTEFIENIPVEETNDYVKNILRNYIFYSYLSDKKVLTLNEITNIGYYDSAIISPK